MLDGLMHPAQPQASTVRFWSLVYQRTADKGDADGLPAFSFLGMLLPPLPDGSKSSPSCRGGPLPLEQTSGYSSRERRHHHVENVGGPMIW